ncbi:MAG TPA: cytochrome c [Rhodanobacter sp.]|nr:cytochrome c [Rhodanobacter sp.]
MNIRTLCLTGILSLAGLSTFPVHADDATTRSARVYDTYCAQCHGANRDGNGINSTAMAVKPRDHTDTKGMGDTPDDELRKAIKDGGGAVNKSVLMPRWDGVLSDAEIDGLVSYLRVVSKSGSK